MHMEMKLPHQDQHSKEVRLQKNKKNVIEIESQDNLKLVSSITQ